MPCVPPFVGPCELLPAPSLLSYVLGELRILPESQGLSEDNDGGDRLRVVVGMKS